MHSYLLHFAFVINAATLACGQSPDIKDLRPASSSPATLDDLQRGQVELKKVLREIEAKLPSSTSRNALISGAPRGIAFDAVKSPLEGRADAPITIVEISDYQCPFCRKYF